MFRYEMAAEVFPDVLLERLGIPNGSWCRQYERADTFTVPVVGDTYDRYVSYVRMCKKAILDFQGMYIFPVSVRATTFLPRIFKRVPIRTLRVL